MKNRKDKEKTNMKKMNSNITKLTTILNRNGINIPLKKADFVRLYQ